MQSTWRTWWIDLHRGLSHKQSWFRERSGFKGCERGFNEARTLLLFTQSFHHSCFSKNQDCGTIRRLELAGTLKKKNGYHRPAESRLVPSHATRPGPSKVLGCSNKVSLFPPHLLRDDGHDSTARRPVFKKRSSLTWSWPCAQSCRFLVRDHRRRKNDSDAARGYSEGDEKKRDQRREMRGRGGRGGKERAECFIFSFITWRARCLPTPGCAKICFNFTFLAESLTWKLVAPVSNDFLCFSHRFKDTCLFYKLN